MDLRCAALERLSFVIGALWVPGGHLEGTARGGNEQKGHCIADEKLTNIKVYPQMKTNSYEEGTGSEYLS